MNSKTENALLQVRVALELYEDLRLATIANDELKIKNLERAVTSVMLAIGVDTLRHLEDTLESRWMIELKQERDKRYA